MAGLLDWITGAVKQQYAQGAPYREAIGGLLQGDPTKFGLLAQEFNRKAQTPEGALDVALNFAPLGVTKIVSPKTQYEIAQEVAQRNAALPVSEGGLGLPANNTAMDRAKAMGFDVDNPMYHGTGADITKFDLRGKTRKGGKAYFVTEDPITAHYYANYKDNPSIYKLLTGNKNAFDYSNPEHLEKIGEKIKNLSDAELVRYGYYQTPENWIDRVSTGDWAILEQPGIIKAMKQAGFDSAKVVEQAQKGNTMLFSNKDIRSVNAAFDPFRRNEADILAGLLAVPATQLMQPEEKKKKRNTK